MRSVSATTSLGRPSAGPRIRSCAKSAPSMPCGSSTSRPGRPSPRTIAADAVWSARNAASSGSAAAGPRRTGRPSSPSTPASASSRGVDTVDDAVRRVHREPAAVGVHEVHRHEARRVVAGRRELGLVGERRLVAMVAVGDQQRPRRDDVGDLGDVRGHAPEPVARAVGVHEVDLRLLARTAGLEELLGAALRVAVEHEDRRQVRARRAQQPQPARDRAGRVRSWRRTTPASYGSSRTRPMKPTRVPRRAVGVEPVLLDEVEAGLGSSAQHALCAPVADQRVDVRLVAVAGQDQAHDVVVAALEQPRALPRLDDVERRRDDVGDVDPRGIEVERAERPHHGRARPDGHPRIVPAAAGGRPRRRRRTLAPWRRRTRSGCATSSRASSSTRPSRCCARTAAARGPATRSCRSTSATARAACAPWCSTTSTCSTPASRAATRCGCSARSRSTAAARSSSSAASSRSSRATPLAYVPGRPARHGRPRRVRRLPRRRARRLDAARARRGRLRRRRASARASARRR